METKPCLTGTRSWQRGGISTCGGTITIYLLRYFNPAPSWQSAEKSLSKQNLKVILPPSLLNWKVALKKKKKSPSSFALEPAAVRLHSRWVQRIRTVPHFHSTKVLKCPQKPLHLSTSLPICVLSVYWQNMTENTALHSILVHRRLELTGELAHLLRLLVGAATAELSHRRVQSVDVWVTVYRLARGYLNRIVIVTAGVVLVM